MPEGIFVAALWLITPAILAVGSIVAGLALYAIPKLWAASREERAAGRQERLQALGRQWSIAYLKEHGETEVSVIKDALVAAGFRPGRVMLRQDPDIIRRRGANGRTWVSYTHGGRRGRTFASRQGVVRGPPEGHSADRVRPRVLLAVRASTGHK